MTANELRTMYWCAVIAPSRYHGINKGDVLE